MKAAPSYKQLPPMEIEGEFIGTITANQLALYCLDLRDMYGNISVKAGPLYINPEMQELCMMDVDEERRGIETVVDGINTVVARVLKDDFKVDGS